MGITQGFLLTGANSVLSSLSVVEDAATRKLMSSIYSSWIKGGMDKADDLQKAKQTLLQSPETNAPYFWAQFVIYGQ